MPDLTDYWVKPAIAWAVERARSQSRDMPWDIVVSSSGPYTAHLVARALKQTKLVGGWAVDFRDLWTDNHAHCGLMPFVFREKQLERAVLLDADLIVTATDGLAGSLRRKCGRQVEVIYNGFDGECQRASIDDAKPRDGTVRLVYTGTLYGHGQDVSPLLGACARLKREHPQLAARLRVCVAGKGIHEWQAAATGFGVKSMMDLQGMISRSDALQLQREADALLLIDWRDREEGVLTAKVFEYLAASAPVLVVGPHHDSEALRLVTRTGRGTYAGGDEASVAATITALFNSAHPFELTRQDEEIAKLSRSRQSMRLLELMRAVRARPGPRSRLAIAHTPSF